MKYLLLIPLLITSGCNGNYTAFNEPIVKQDSKRECFVISYRFGLKWHTKFIYDDLSIYELRRVLNYPDDIRKDKSYCLN